MILHVCPPSNQYVYLIWFDVPFVSSTSPVAEDVNDNDQTSVPHIFAIGDVT